MPPAKYPPVARPSWISCGSIGGRPGNELRSGTAFTQAPFTRLRMRRVWLFHAPALYAM